MAQHGTETSEDGSAASIRPSSDDVRRELEVLREGVGLSPERIRQKAPRIQELDLVTDQLDFNRIHRRDRHIAAYSAIGCVVEHAISNYQHQQILILTLRYDRTLVSIRRDERAWSEIAKAPTVTQRDELTQALLVYGKSTYFAMRKEAYAELANQMVMRTVTPCRSGGATGLADEMFRLTLRQYLGYLTVEARKLAREVLAEDALLQVHDGWKSPISEDSPAAEFNHVIGRALKGAYPAAVEELTYRRRQPGKGAVRPSEYFLHEAHLKFLLRPLNSLGIWRFASQYARPGGYSDTDADYALAVARLSESLDALAAVLSAPPPATSTTATGKTDTSGNDRQTGTH